VTAPCNRFEKSRWRLHVSAIAQKASKATSRLDDLALFDDARINARLTH